MKELGQILTSNKEFYPRLLKIAIPTIVEFFISSLVTLLDVFMIGQLGTDEVAAVGIVSQVFTLFLLFMIGFGSGAAVFTAQYWGKKDIKNLRAILGITLLFTSIFSIIFAAISILFPREIVSLFTDNKNVQLIAEGYFRLIGLSQIFFGIGIPFYSILNSTGKVKISLTATSIALTFDTLISYCLIFGIGFFPQLGVIGTGIGTLSGRIIQTGLLIIISYLLKLPTAGKLKEIFSFSKKMILDYLRITIPVVLQHFLWGLGYTMYIIIYSRISTESIAAFTIAGTIESIYLMFLTGIGLSAATMIGNRIGANEEKKAINYAEKFLIIIYIFSFMIMVIILLVKDFIIGSYNITNLSKIYVSNILLVMALVVWGKASNILFYTGILKGGGDTTICMIIDIGGMWLIGVPIALITAFIFNFPVYIIVALISIEEIIKMIIGYFRFSSRKWIKNVTIK